MDVMTAIQTRRSVRSYTDRPIEEEKLQAVLEAARLAPSARNMQEWKFVVVRDPATRQQLAKAAKDQAFVGQAPAVIAACATAPDYVMSCGNPASLIDLAIAVDHMTLKAVEEGLGTCWIGAFDQNRVKTILGAPENVNIVVLLPIGYPADQPSAKSRKLLAEIVCHDRWVH